MKFLLIRNIRLPYTADDCEFTEKAKARLLRVGASLRNVSFALYKKSLDARDRSDICFNASVLARGEFGSLSPRKLASADIVESACSIIETTLSGSNSVTPEIVL